MKERSIFSCTPALTCEINAVPEDEMVIMAEISFELQPVSIIVSSTLVASGRVTGQRSIAGRKIGKLARGYHTIYRVEYPPID